MYRLKKEIHHIIKRASEVVIEVCLIFGWNHASCFCFANPGSSLILTEGQQACFFVPLPVLFASIVCLNLLIMYLVFATCRCVCMEMIHHVSQVMVFLTQTSSCPCRQASVIHPLVKLLFRFQQLTMESLQESIFSRLLCADILQVF